MGALIKISILSVVYVLCQKLHLLMFLRCRGKALSGQELAEVSQSDKV